MSDSKKKSSYVIGITPEEVSGFLRELADEIEDKSEGVRQSVKNFRKLTLKLKRYEQRISADVKIGKDGVEDKKKESGHSRLKKYRAAKKRMKHVFEEICDSVSKGVLPGTDLLESFFRDSELMVSFPGHDKKYYDDHIAACEEFRTALDKDDLTAAKAGCDKIRHIKAECHKKYK